MAVLQFDFKSELLNHSARISAILPETSSCGLPFVDGHRFPVLYLLHDNGGDHTDLIRYSQIELFAAKKGVAVVMPELGCSFCSDQRHGNGKKEFTYLREELPRLLQAILPLAGEPGKIFVAGIGTGAYGAVKWALTEPDKIAFAAGIAGVFEAEVHELLRQPNYDPAENSYFNQTFESMEAYRGSDDALEVLARKRGAGAVRILSLCGSDDPAIEPSRSFAARMAESLPLTLELLPGGHDWSCWNAALERLVQILPVRE
jgi:S-formylglutathione hydrolase FrmB